MHYLRIVLFAITLYFASNLNAQTAEGAISFVGFFNSETPNFRPAPISYEAVIDFELAFEELSDFLADQDIQVRDLGEFELVTQAFDDTAIAELRATLLSWLSQQYQFLLAAGATAPSCDGLAFPDISSYGQNQGWAADSQIFIILGLEALSPSGRGLRSGISVLEHNGRGECIAVASKEYDFTNYGTSAFVADSIELIAVIRDSGTP